MTNIDKKYAKRFPDHIVLVEYQNPVKTTINNDDIMFNLVILTPINLVIVCDKLALVSEGKNVSIQSDKANVPVYTLVQEKYILKTKLIMDGLKCLMSIYNTSNTIPICIGKNIASFIVSVSLLGSLSSFESTSLMDLCTPDYMMAKAITNVQIMNDSVNSN